MQQVIPVNSKVLKDILSTLDEVKIEVKKLHKKVEDLGPIYGSDAWWDKETKEALEEVKKGHVVKFDNVKDAIRYLHS